MRHAPAGRRDTIAAFIRSGPDPAREFGPQPRNVSAYPHPLIAREGWPYIAVAFVAALIVSVLAGMAWAFPFWVIVAFVVQFFRDPPREVPQHPSVVLSPADGRIVKVEKVRDPYTERDALLVSVFMNVFNVHSNRSPVDGTVESIKYEMMRGLNLHSTTELVRYAIEHRLVVF